MSSFLSLPEGIKPPPSAKNTPKGGIATFKKFISFWKQLPSDCRRDLIILAVSLAILAGAIGALALYVSELCAPSKPTYLSVSVFSSSLTTCAAMASPADAGTNAVLAGACLPFSLITAGMGVSGE